MPFWMTQSLLSSWRYSLEAPEPQAEAAQAAFRALLRRERREPTPAMTAGIRFEADVNALAAGRPIQPPDPAWEQAARRFARRCAGGQAQVPVSGTLRAGGLDLVLYGLCDYVKAGRIYDIKKVGRYEYGKYITSPQHPMYMHLLPEARRFDYLIFDGSRCYLETYRREDVRPVSEIIEEFFQWLHETGQQSAYVRHWYMDSKKEEAIHGF